MRVLRQKEMSIEEKKAELKLMSALDDAAAEAGGYLAFRTKEQLENEPSYDYPALSCYAREKGVAPCELSKEEIERFRIAA